MEEQAFRDLRQTQEEMETSVTQDVYHQRLKADVDPSPTRAKHVSILGAKDASRQTAKRRKHLAKRRRRKKPVSLILKIMKTSSSACA